MVGNDLDDGAQECLPAGSASFGSATLEVGVKSEDIVAGAPMVSVLPGST